MDKMVDNTTNHDNKERSHGTTVYAMRGALASSDEREVFDALIETVMRDGRCRPEASHGTGVRELTANEVAKVQWAMGQYHVLVLMGHDPKHGSEEQRIKQKQVTPGKQITNTCRKEWANGRTTAFTKTFENDRGKA